MTRIVKGRVGEMENGNGDDGIGKGKGSRRWKELKKGMEGGDERHEQERQVMSRMQEGGRLEKVPNLELGSLTRVERKGWKGRSRRRFRLYH